MAKWPATAVAAASAGDTRWVRPPRPWRPSKLRLDVDALRSPEASLSGFMPRHIEQPAERHSAPAALNTASRPSASAWARTAIEPGTTSIRIDGAIRRQAEAEGLHEIFLAAGFEWRRAGCSMCLGMNPDILQPGERCASTSNRNFEGRQGAGGRTHLVSPQVAAATAIAGHIADARELVPA